MAAHAKFSPSGAHRWMPCPGSIALESDYPNESSEYADEGTAAHTILAECLLEGKDAIEHLGRVLTVEQKDDDGNITSSRDFTVDEEMAMHVQSTLESVRRRAATRTLLVEQKVEFTKSIGTLEKQFGTSDIIMVSTDGEEVDVEDFKYGAGVKVYASEIVGHEEVLNAETGDAELIPILKGNKQMLSYALGVLETLGGVIGDFKRFNLRVHQPRCDGGWEDEFTVTVEDVIQHGVEMRRASLQAAVGIDCHSYIKQEDDVRALPDGWQRLELIAEKMPADLFNPSEKACRFCKAKATCKALRETVSQNVFEDLSALASQEGAENAALMGASVPSGGKLGIAYGMLSLIRDWCNAIEKECERQVHAGMTVIGPDGEPMKLVEGKKGDRKWIDEVMAESMLVGVLPPEKVYSKKIITAAAAAKILDKKKTAATWAPFKELISQAPGKATIALGSDPRPKYEAKAGEDEFVDLTQDPSA